MSLPYIIRLWKTSNCASKGGKLVDTIAAGTAGGGSITYRVPLTTGQGDDFYVEIADTCVHFAAFAACSTAVYFLPGVHVRMK